MKTNVITQPDVDMGSLLIGLLDSQAPHFNKIWIISAFANQHAVRRLVPHIIKAKSRGAVIRVVVGIDLQSTSAEALREIESLGITAIIVHNKRPGHTFHPKIYLFEATGTKADLFIGSNNLTEGGLYTNYEASSETVFELPQDESEYAAALKSLEKYINPSGKTALPLTSDLIDVLVSRGDVPTEKQLREARKRDEKWGKKDAKNLPPSPFGGESTIRPPKSPKSVKSEIVKKTTIPSKTKLAIVSRGVLLWEKSNLPASDVQRQIGNVTGGLRLTQARWKVNGQTINQTEYFRYTVFGNLQWEDRNSRRTISVIAKASFEINILGKNYGTHELSISHKPSGEAGQGNYTTILHWGPLGETIRNLNLIGKTFRLYAPANEQVGTYFIDII